MTQDCKPPQAGNILFMLFIAIALLAGMTMLVSTLTQQQSDTFDSVRADKEVEALVGQGALLAGAVQQMQANGAPGVDTDGIAPDVGISGNLDAMTPGNAAWDTAPHKWKIYHPFGGGVTYMNATAPSSPLASNFQISRGASVEGVGPPAATENPDILFTATISSASACGLINKRLLGNATVNTLSAAVFTALAAGNAVTTVSAAACPTCVGVPRGCVQQLGSSAWLYYQALLPN